MKRRIDILRWGALTAIIIAAVFNYRYMFSYTTLMFKSPLEDMSHGWLVPFVSLYVLWWRRRAFQEAAGQPSWIGAAWVALFLVFAWFGGRGLQTRLEQVSLIGLVWAIPFAFWGRGVERLMRFPAAYLIFTIPVSSFIDFFTIHLRIFSSSLATGLLNGVGIAVERSGTALFSKMPGAEFNVDVADPCSGIRSLFAMMALTAAYAFFTQKGAWRKWALFACSLPIAVIGNMVRIMSICMVAAWFGQEAATGYYHDYSGFVIFVVGVYLMFFAGERIKRIKGAKIGDGACATEHASSLREAATHHGTWVVTCVSALVLAVFIVNRAMPPPVFGSASFVAESLPERIGAFESDVPWFCHEPQCLETAEASVLKRGTVNEKTGYVCPACGGLMHSISLGEYMGLPRDTVIHKRNYRAMDGISYSVSVVVSGANRGSIHRAEMCLPSQGFTMLAAERMSLQLTGGRELLVRKIDAQRSRGSLVSLVYWFESRERESCSHTERILADVWDRSIHNRINRWVMVAVNVSSGLSSPESVERFEEFLSELVPQIFNKR